MSARRKNGAFVSAAVTEAARRQLMTPVPCWELKWTTLSNTPPGSSLKFLRWVKTDAQQQFSDDEEEIDDALAPLPEEPEVPEGDDDEAEEEVPKSDSQIQSRDVSEPRLPPTELNTAPPSPKPHPLSHSMIPDLDTGEPVDLDVPPPPELDIGPSGDLGPSGNLIPSAGEDPGDLQILDPTMDGMSQEVLDMDMIAALDEPLDADAAAAFNVDVDVDQTMDSVAADELMLSLTSEELEKFAS